MTGQQLKNIPSWGKNTFLGGEGAKIYYNKITIQKTLGGQDCCKKAP